MRSGFLFPLVLSACAGGHQPDPPRQNSPPSTPGVRIDPVDPDTEASLLCLIDAEAEDADGDAVSYSYSWTKDGVDAGIAGPVVEPAATLRDEVWACSVVPTDDGSAEGEPGVAEVTIANTAPTAATVSISPEAPDTEQPLLCAVVSAAEDIDGDAITYTFAWTLDGADAGIGSDTVLPSLTDRGQEWSCTASPSDGTSEGPGASASVVVVNALPSAPVVQVDPLTPDTDADLSCSVVTDAVDPDGDPITYAFDWTVDGVASGISDSLVAASATTRDEEWTCSVVANDGFEAGPAGSASMTVLNAAPSAPGVALTPVEPTAEDDLLCSVAVPSIDPDGDAVVYSFTWLLDGVATGFAGSVLSAVETENGDEWTCVVTGSDGSLTGPAGQAVLAIRRAVFLFTAADQQLVVPSGVTSVHLALWGAGGGGGGEVLGGGGAGGSGGGGGYVSGDLTVSGGDVLVVVVGEGGTAAAYSNGGPFGAFGGGGPSGAANSTEGGGGGGGRSAVLFGGIEVATAAGGGGGGNSNDACLAPGSGGAGGGATGSDGGDGFAEGQTVTGGEGAQLAGGGGGGQSVFNSQALAQPGSQLLGGAGATLDGANCRGAGGGGGGGWFGGGGGGSSEGGGAACVCAGGGGGGGSSLTSGLLAPVVLAGSGSTPANAFSPDRGGAAEGGVFTTDGASGLVIVTWE
jgi:hypothetical protein